MTDEYSAAVFAHFGYMLVTLHQDDDLAYMCGTTACELLKHNRRHDCISLCACECSCLHACVRVSVCTCTCMRDLVSVCPCVRVFVCSCVLVCVMLRDLAYMGIAFELLKHKRRYDWAVYVFVYACVCVVRVQCV